MIEERKSQAANQNPRRPVDGIRRCTNLSVTYFEFKRLDVHPWLSYAKHQEVRLARSAAK